MDEQSEIEVLKQRVERLEEVLLQLTGRALPDLGIDYQSIVAEAQRQVDERVKLMAIKVYSERTGCSLIGAKNRVDSMITRRQPPKRSSPG